MPDAAGRPREKVRQLGDIRRNPPRCHGFRDSPGSLSTLGISQERRSAYELLFLFVCRPPLLELAVQLIPLLRC
jgi:hypothetical protein